MSGQKERRVYRLLGADTRDLAGLESWLGDMAAKGLHFREKGDVFAVFVRGEPKAVRYRLDAISALCPVPDAEGQAQAEALGWRYVEKLGDFSVYRCDDPAVPELHTDPVVQSYTMDELAKKLRREVVKTACTSLLMLGLCYFIFFCDPTPVLSLVRSTGGVLFPVILLLDFLLTAASLYQIFHTLALRRQLRMGLSMEHRTNYRRKAALYRVSLVLLILILAAQAYGAVREWSVSGVRILSKEGNSPIVLALSNLDNSPLLRGWPFGVTQRWSFLAPVQYRIARMTLASDPGGQVREQLLQMDYYGLSLPALAGPVMEDLRRAEDTVWHEEAYPGLDRAFASRDGKLLLLQQEGSVLRVEYSDAANLADALPELTAVLAAID